MHLHQMRVVEERNELSARLERLRSFICTATFAGLPQDERSRLSRQSVYMGAYLDILNERIAAFDPQA